MPRLRLRGALALLALLLGLLVVPGPAASAATPLAGCRGGDCTGKDPEAQGCGASARTYDEFTHAGIRFELRASSECRAAWTRVTSSFHSNIIFGQIRARNRVFGVQATEGTNWTQMISTINRQVRTCRADWFDIAPEECTPWH